MAATATTQPQATEDRYVQFMESGLAYRGRVWKSGETVRADAILLSFCEPAKSGKIWCREVTGSRAQGAEELPNPPRGMKNDAVKGLKPMTRAEMKAEYED